ncbi:MULTISPECIES: hypothetical protein [Pseudomonas]|uniref:Uncharacterized protein n=1 Tax=Pseudomonas putida TaxID=303 RepID=A0A3M8TEU4_PSEPU|nr:hypothetical protein [Pseudomonas putida]MCO6690236.1 hypothetical protein [Pseudomonas shirazica]RNF89660.1 hypothetical protein EFK07_11860 [Pseudomonas putida]
MKKTLVAVFTCTLALGATALLPADVSPIGSAYAKGNGNGGGKGGFNGNGVGYESDHAGKATRNHGESGNHYGSLRNDDNGRGTTRSGIAHSKEHNKAGRSSSKHDR